MVWKPTYHKSVNCTKILLVLQNVKSEGMFDPFLSLTLCTTNSPTNYSFGTPFILLNHFNNSVPRILQ